MAKQIWLRSPKKIMINKKYPIISCLLILSISDFKSPQNENIYFTNEDIARKIYSDFDERMIFDIVVFI